MINRVKEIVNRLDGYSDSELAFAVTEIKTADEGGMYQLTVTPYNKDDTEVTEEQHTEELAEMTHRLLGYKVRKYMIIHAILQANGDWYLTVRYYEKKDSEEKGE